MRSADIIVLGGGIIGLSLAFELRKTGAEILVLERRQPGLEASHAAAGMLAPWGHDFRGGLLEMAQASFCLYPEFVQEIEDASGRKTDFRRHGTIIFPTEYELPDLPASARELSEEEQQRLEPFLSPRAHAFFSDEATIDPRALTAACAEAARRHGVRIASGEQALEIKPSAGSLEIITQQTQYSAKKAINCCGAWTGHVKPLEFPTRPVKGQMLGVVTRDKTRIEHVVRSGDVYIVPRSDGRILIGATVEEAGFDKRVDPQTIQCLHQAAADLVPALGEARMLEAWAGLRPSTPDDLPMLGSTSMDGYFVATGHFRNGFLLAPITARMMAQLVITGKTEVIPEVFSPSRFLR